MKLDREKVKAHPEALDRFREALLLAGVDARASAMDDDAVIDAVERLLTAVVEAGRALQAAAAEALEGLGQALVAAQAPKVERIADRHGVDPTLAQQIAQDLGGRAMRQR